MGPNESLIKVIIITLTIYLQWTTNKILIKKHGSPTVATGGGGVLVAFTTGIVVLPLLPPPLW
jgi:hypothetical protein